MNKKNGFIVTTLAALFSIFLAIVTILIVPIGAIFFGVFIGWAIELIAGNIVVDGLNSLGLTQVSEGDLPKLFGALSLLLAFLAGTIYIGANGKGAK